jgi:hypothetical protein
MTLLTNEEFEKLASSQTNRIKVWASNRVENSPNGSFTLKDLDSLIEVCAYSGDKSIGWLKNLKSLAVSGKLHQLKANRNTYEDHRYEIELLASQKKIPFAIGDKVQCVANGKMGVVADYNTSSEEYIVVLDPTEIRVFDKEAAATYLLTYLLNEEEMKVYAKDSLKKGKKHQVKASAVMFTGAQQEKEFSSATEAYQWLEQNQDAIEDAWVDGRKVFESGHFIVNPVELGNLTKRDWSKGK